tara:strand:+ start:4321 stop:4683 length:363 start_codon:yes stop_codon:yes gene_type:complete
MSKDIKDSENVQVFLKMSDDDAKDFEKNVNDIIHSTNDYINDTGASANTLDVFKTVRDTFSGDILILFASQMLTELIRTLRDKKIDDDITSQLMEAMAKQLEVDGEEVVSCKCVADKGRD